MGATSSKSHSDRRSSPAPAPSAPPLQHIIQHNVTCSICQESFHDSRQCVATRCGHIFDQRCVTDWIIRNRSCPDCRTTITTMDLYKVYFNSMEIETGSADMIRKLERAQIGLAESKSMCEIAVQDKEKLKAQLKSQMMHGTEANRKEIEELKRENKELVGKMKFMENGKNQKINGLEKKIRFLYKDINLKDKHRELQEKMIESRDEVIAALKDQLGEMTLAAYRAALNDDPQIKLEMEEKISEIAEIAKVPEASIANKKDGLPEEPQEDPPPQAINWKAAPFPLKNDDKQNNAQGQGQAKQSNEKNAKRRQNNYKKAALAQPEPNGINPQLQATRSFRPYQKKGNTQKPLEA